MKKILVISSSPRKNGNTELLINEFQKGALESGNEIERINLNDKKVSYCTNCNGCRNGNGECVIKDDHNEIAEKMLDADVVVFATPVYFYSVTAQLKTFIDRMYAREHEFFELPDKEAYYILACAAPTKEYMSTAIADLDGFVRCLRTVKTKGIIKGFGAMAAGDVVGTPAYKEAYKIGKSII